ncbi:MAG: flippase-like domain-containing protein [Bacteroidetes bacterium]|nr:flippase-like domain-containing protein [Bacteroidota bacterium]
MKRYKKQLVALLKLIVSVLALYVVFRKLDLESLGALLARLRIWPLLAATLMFVLSKALSAVRLQLLFSYSGLQIGQLENARLYLLGMFYNLFLPGGIGGDGYKIFYLNRRYHTAARISLTAILLDRLSGVFMLALLALLLLIVLNRHNELAVWSVAAIPLLVLAFCIMMRVFFRKLMPVFLLMNVYSLGVQLFQLVSVYFILLSLAQTNDLLPYFFLFLVSSIVTIIPITIGGAGARELTFLYGAKWFGVNVELAVAISFIFYLITAITSLAGIYYAIRGVRDPDETNAD